MLKKEYAKYLDIIEKQLQKAVGDYKVIKRRVEKDVYRFTAEIHLDNDNYAGDMDVTVDTSLDVRFSCVLADDFLICSDIMEIANDLNRRLRFGKVYLDWEDGNRLRAEYDVILAENPDKVLLEGQIFQICNLILRVFIKMFEEMQEQMMKLKQKYEGKASGMIDIKDVIINPFRDKGGTEERRWNWR